MSLKNYYRFGSKVGVFESVLSALTFFASPGRVACGPVFQNLVSTQLRFKDRAPSLFSVPRCSRISFPSGTKLRGLTAEPGESRSSKKRGVVPIFGKQIILNSDVLILHAVFCSKGGKKAGIPLYLDTIETSRGWRKKVFKRDGSNVLILL